MNSASIGPQANNSQDFLASYVGKEKNPERWIGDLIDEHHISYGDRVFGGVPNTVKDKVANKTIVV
jgi:hypothetical protein|tara:strand:- start:7996 stop:8193 length:198 start_codon:yes stop_codon:yes gene_type:complete